MGRLSKKISKHLVNNPKTLITVAGTLALLSFLFAIGCIYKIYETAYTTRLFCNLDNYQCKILKINILGEEVVEYEFAPAELMKVELFSQKNVLKQKVYNVVLQSKQDPGKKFILTPESFRPAGQDPYLMLINSFLNSYDAKQITLENPRHKLKAIGLSAAAAACLVAIFLILDIIKAVQKLQDGQVKKKSYQEVLGNGYF